MVWPLLQAPDFLCIKRTMFLWKNRLAWLMLIVATASSFLKKTDEVGGREVCGSFLVLRQACWSSSSQTWEHFPCWHMTGSFKTASDAGVTIHWLGLGVKQVYCLLQAKQQWAHLPVEMRELESVAHVSGLWKQPELRQISRQFKTHANVSTEALLQVFRPLALIREA